LVLLDDPLIVYGRESVTHGNGKTFQCWSLVEEGGVP